MTIKELIEKLEEKRAICGDDAVVQVVCSAGEYDEDGEYQDERNHYFDIEHVSDFFGRDPYISIGDVGYYGG